MFAPIRICFFAICLLLFLSLTGQGIDQARDRIYHAKQLQPGLERDSILIHQYNSLAEAFSSSDLDKARAYLDTLETLQAKSQWDKAEGLYYRAKGKYFDRSGVFEKALQYYTQAIEAFEQVGDRSEYLVYTYILKAFVLNNNGLPVACERELEAIRPLAETLENKNYLAWIIDAFGDHYFYSAFGKQDFEKALDYYLEVEALSEGIQNPVIIADNAHGLAGCYLRLGQEEKARRYTQKALNLSIENGYSNVIFAVYGDQADVYESRGQFDQAIRYRQLSLEYARQTGWIEMVSRGERNIANTYKSAGDFENALLHFERLKVIEDSLAREEVLAHYNELEAKYASEKKDLEIAELRSQNLRLFRNVLVILLLGGIGFLLYYLNVNKTLRQKNRDLQKRNEEIQAALVKGQNIERERMATELHDNINSKIAATKWMLETISNEETTPQQKTLIDSIIQSVNEIYDDVRFISHNLVPRDISAKSLPELVDQLIQNLNRNQKITFSLNAQMQEYTLSGMIKLNSYSIIMELLSNVLKHADCRHAQIDLSLLAGKKLQIIVQDDGKGFNPDGEFRGTGLKNVRARIHNLGGDIRIRQLQPSGTEILISIPLR